MNSKGTCAIVCLTIAVTPLYPLTRKGVDPTEASTKIGNNLGTDAARLNEGPQEQDTRVKLRTQNLRHRWPGLQVTP